MFVVVVAMDLAVWNKHSEWMNIAIAAWRFAFVTAAGKFVLSNGNATVMSNVAFEAEKYSIIIQVQL